MRDDTVENFLEQLAGRAPTPGGGATAALHAAQAAALVAMVGRYSDTAKYAAHADRITDIVRTADRLRADALRLAEADVDAFGAVGGAYKLPKDTPDQAVRPGCSHRRRARRGGPGTGERHPGGGRDPLPWPRNWNRSATPT